MKFTDFDLNPNIEDAILAMGFEDATPIQEAAIPLAIEGKDLIACAQTGTGKTAAYLLPVMHKLLEGDAPKSNSVSCIIIAPTRELAIQIDQQLEGMSYFAPLSTVAIYGGNDAGNWEKQRSAIKNGADIIVATPGRLIQHFNQGYLKTDDLQFLVLDEADRMLDMGFQEDINQIVGKLPESRQTLMFSATMPPKIRSLAKNILKDPEEITFKVSTTAEGVLQGAFMAYDEQKASILKGILVGNEEKLPTVFVFCSTKSKVKELGHEMKRWGLKAEPFQSDLEQKEREQIMQSFKNKQFQVLVATDIVSRGIDIDDVSMVINYDVPNDPEDYVHRVGRTARAERKGFAVTLINPRDCGKFRRIEELIEKEVMKVPLPESFGGQPSYSTERRGNGGRFNKKRNYSGNKGGGGRKGNYNRRPKNQDA
ncbi:DEAD/DEAH box helicase [Persicobacter sp. CCB-QB2]|uniref:DEAD/DEAH box helicase n=1 Tax=Persicobacter sp. CCB-QB2 TaxID=1561025 RepID=UPI0006A9B95A|nr:DEAD/DEAH box helicase [Persicobacter sp. CCB-QB2]